MYTLIVFGIICSVQFIFIWIKISEIREYKELVDTIGSNVISTATKEQFTNNKYYSTVVKSIAYLWRNFKKVLIIPFILILFINFIVSLILGGILSFIF